MVFKYRNKMRLHIISQKFYNFARLIKLLFNHVLANKLDKLISTLLEEDWVNLPLSSHLFVFIEAIVTRDWKLSSFEFLL